MIFCVCRLSQAVPAMTAEERISGLDELYADPESRRNRALSIEALQDVLFGLYEECSSSTPCKKEKTIGNFLEFGML